MPGGRGGGGRASPPPLPPLKRRGGGGGRPGGGGSRGWRCSRGRRCSGGRCCRRGGWRRRRRNADRHGCCVGDRELGVRGDYLICASSIARDVSPTCVDGAACGAPNDANWDRTAVLHV